MQVITEWPQNFPTGILAHGPHAVVRVGPERVVRTQTGATDG